MSEWILLLGKDFILPIVISIIVFRIQSRMGQKAKISKMRIVPSKGQENALHFDEIKKCKEIIVMSYVRYERIDRNQSPRKSIKFERVSYHRILEDFKDMRIFKISFDKEKESGLVLCQVFDSAFEIYDFDEDNVPITRMASGDYCLICKEEDLPYSIKGIYGNYPVSYEINITNGYIRPKLIKRR